MPGIMDAGSSQGCSARRVRCRGRSCRVPGWSRALNGGSSLAASPGVGEQVGCSGRECYLSFGWQLTGRMETLERSQAKWSVCGCNAGRLGGNGFKRRRDSSVHAGCHVCLSQGFNSRTWYGSTSCIWLLPPPAGIGDGHRCAVGHHAPWLLKPATHIRVDGCARFFSGQRSVAEVSETARCQPFAEN